MVQIRLPVKYRSEPVQDWCRLTVGITFWNIYFYPLSDISLPTSHLTLNLTPWCWSMWTKECGVNISRYFQQKKEKGFKVTEIKLVWDQSVENSWLKKDSVRKLNLGRGCWGAVQKMTPSEPWSSLWLVLLWSAERKLIMPLQNVRSHTH